MCGRGCQQHEAAGQSVTPGIRHPGSGRTGSRCIWSGTCFSYGGRHYQLGTEYGADCLQTGDEIILPRNVHRSVLNALVLCGAIPVYVNPEVDQRLGISLRMKREQVAKAIAEHPKAVAVLVNNPTYYGISSDLRAIVKMAHDAGMLCLADEAHGTHFYFGGGLPVSAMAAGADC